MRWPLVTRKRHERKVVELVGQYVLLEEKYKKVQQGYNLGVLEGTRQAYVNVRAFLTDNMEHSPPQERAFLITWLHPRLGALGDMESGLIAELRGYPDDVKEELRKLRDV